MSEDCNFNKVTGEKAHQEVTFGKDLQDIREQIIKLCSFLGQKHCILQVDPMRKS